ncbi:MAG TPA: helix-turn-helix domain-containing protein [Solirubrobacteraceae bacterium]|nr:helix-turn-helix domain-containing protein [Solirubrobacteraceae bacterium]
MKEIVDAYSPVSEVAPQMMADRDLAAESSAAARELTRLLIDKGLPRLGPLEDDAAPVALVAIVRVWARRGIDLRTLIRGYRRAQAAFWGWWMADVAARIEDPALRMAVLEHSWERVSAWYEIQLDRIEEIYSEERDRWLSGAQARRAELIREILAGEPIEQEPASTALGYDLRRAHVGVVLWTDGEPADALATLEEAVRELAATQGATATLTVPAGSSALWAWIACDAAPARAPALPAGVWAALGGPARGLAGFRGSHEAAQLVRRLMPFAGRPERLVGFDDVSLACLMAREPAAMRRVVEHELGGLARRDPNTARLRETVRVYLESGANAREAAERLNMHKNTVHYRLARVEELRGRPLGERRLEFEVALTLAHLLGDRALPRDPA